MRDFHQQTWDSTVEEDCRQLVRLAVREDLDRAVDWTTVALVPSGTPGAASIVARQHGVVAGLLAATLGLGEMDAQVHWQAYVEDGAAVIAGQCLARLQGSARSLLTAERLLLNLIGRLSGVATLARRYVDAVAGTAARVYDTRKTTPGWRRLEKYAVRCGGACNHRGGLYDAVLIKDNHLALGRGSGSLGYTPAEAVRRAREFLAQAPPGDPRHGMIVEVEVESLDQLAEVLPVGPDLVLLDNMPLDRLRQAVATRNELNPRVELEASGGINLETIGQVAATGVERISVGALTHSAVCFDVAMDWG